MAFEQGGDDGTLRYRGRLCVLDVNGLRERIMSEAHNSRYSIHPGSTKMYHDLKEVYWWNDMKKNIADFVAKCPNCQQVKVEHQRPGDRGAQFTANFWKSFQKGLGTRVNLSTVFHPQTDGQAEHTIQTLEDMLRACVIDFKGNWDDHLPLIEFAYNNSYHSSIKMARTKLYMGEGVDHQLKVMGDPSLVVPTEIIGVKDNLSYEEIPVAILDRQIRKLRTKEIVSVKVLWRNQKVEEATWEAEEDMKSRYPHIFEEQKENVEGN
ncbi:uncharacterized protein [Nicotiana sylvestris]|uniref:uncharacterized protein n=1 Tax=Nicotiana sylvestris TaxID=4096 RepID=UPI00388CAD59